MKPLVQKMSTLGLLKLEIVFGTLIMLAALIALPVSILVMDAKLMTNPYVLGVVVAGMLMFALLGYYAFVRTYFLYRKMPAVQVETDGEYLYIHTKKEAKIPLSDLVGAEVRIELPFLFQKEFVNRILVYFFSEEYGDIILEIPGYGSYRMRFVSHVKETANRLIHYLSEAVGEMV